MLDTLERAARIPTGGIGHRTHDAAKVQPRHGQDHQWAGDAGRVRLFCGPKTTRVVSLPPNVADFLHRRLERGGSQVAELHRRVSSPRTATCTKAVDHALARAIRAPSVLSSRMKRTCRAVKDDTLLAIVQKLPTSMVVSRARLNSPSRGRTFCCNGRRRPFRCPESFRNGLGRARHRRRRRRICPGRGGQYCGRSPRCSQTGSRARG